MEIGESKCFVCGRTGYKMKKCWYCNAAMTMQENKKETEKKIKKNKKQNRKNQKQPIKSMNA